jgi:hypothetical protein
MSHPPSLAGRANDVRPGSHGHGITQENLLAILALTGPGEQRLDEWRRPRLVAIRHGWCPHC